MARRRPFPVYAGPSVDEARARIARAVLSGALSPEQGAKAITDYAAHVSAVTGTPQSAADGRGRAKPAPARQTGSGAISSEINKPSPGKAREEAKKERAERARNASAYRADLKKAERAEATAERARNRAAERAREAADLAARAKQSQSLQAEARAEVAAQKAAAAAAAAQKAEDRAAKAEPVPRFTDRQLQARRDREAKAHARRLVAEYQRSERARKDEAKATRALDKAAKPRVDEIVKKFGEGLKKRVKDGKLTPEQRKTAIRNYRETVKVAERKRTAVRLDPAARERARAEREQRIRDRAAGIEAPAQPAPAPGDGFRAHIVREVLAGRMTPEAGARAISGFAAAEAGKAEKRAAAKAEAEQQAKEAAARGEGPPPPKTAAEKRADREAARVARAESTIRGRVERGELTPEQGRVALDRLHADAADRLASERGGPAGGGGSEGGGGGSYEPSPFGGESFTGYGASAGGPIPLEGSALRSGGFAGDCQQADHAAASFFEKWHGAAGLDGRIPEITVTDRDGNSMQVPPDVAAAFAAGDPDALADWLAEQHENGDLGDWIDIETEDFADGVHYEEGA